MIQKSPSTSGFKKNMLGLISVWATDASNNAVALNQAKTFSFNVDVSGGSSVTPQSAAIPSVANIDSLANSAYLLNVGVRNTQNVLFCAKGAHSACADSDWQLSSCEATKGCTIEGNTLKNTAASAFGTYALCSPPCSLPPPTVGAGSQPAASSGSSSSSGSSLSNGAIAAIVLVPTISICLVGAALLIRRGSIFSNIAAFDFLRPASSNNANPSVDRLPASRPPPTLPAPRQINIAEAAAAATAGIQSDDVLNMPSAPPASIEHRSHYIPHMNARSNQLPATPPPRRTSDARQAIADTVVSLNPRRSSYVLPDPPGLLPDPVPTAPPLDDDIDTFAPHDHVESFATLPDPAPHLDQRVHATGHEISHSSSPYFSNTASRKPTALATTQVPSPSELSQRFSPLPKRQYLADSTAGHR